MPVYHAQANFGNAGAVNSLLGRAKQALAARGGAAAAVGEIIVADLGGAARAKVRSVFYFIYLSDHGLPYLSIYFMSPSLYVWV